MRVISLVAVAFLAIASAAPVDEKTFLQRQKYILELLNHVNQPSMYEDIVKYGKEYKIEDNLSMYTNKKAVEEFLTFFHHGFLPRGEIFSVFNKAQLDEAISLFHVFYYAKDWETFFKTASWARQNINAGIFVYALNVAVLHREDTRGMILPPPYEIYPYYFVNSEVIQKAYRIKMQEGVLEPQLAQYNGYSVEGNNYTLFANYSGWYVQYNDEQKLSYFTEDIGLNTYYYYFHADYPFWMGGDEFALKKDRRGELYFYVHQQLLARYYLERLSNDMYEIPVFSWNRPIKTGFYPSLKYHNGMAFPTRPNDYDLSVNEDVFDLELVKDLEIRIRDSIHLSKLVLPDGSIKSLKDHETFELLANLIQGNEDSPNQRYYRYLLTFARIILGAAEDTFDKTFALPSALEHFETSLRDPVFWQLYKRIMQYFMTQKNVYPAYTKEELLFPGVKIDNVEFSDKLVTFFDYFYYDITNAVYLTEEEIKQRKENIIFYVRQLRLNHKPFSVTVNVKSDKATDAVIRIFLGPKFDGMGNLIDINDNRFNFVELDSFVYELKTGENVIERESSDFLNIVTDRTPTRDVFKSLDSALAGSEHFTYNMSEAHFGFPDRLLLPKGKKGGMPFKFYVIVSPHVEPTLKKGTGYDQNMFSGVGTGARYIDARPFGYPFNHPIVEYDFFTPNMYYEDVMIFHKSDFDLIDPSYARVAL